MRFGIMRASFWCVFTVPPFSNVQVFEILHRKVKKKSIYIERRLYTAQMSTIGHLHEFMVDHRNYTHNLSSCEIKA